VDLPDQSVLALLFDVPGIPQTLADLHGSEVESGQRNECTGIPQIVTTGPVYCWWSLFHKFDSSVPLEYFWWTFRCKRDIVPFSTTFVQPFQSVPVTGIIQILDAMVKKKNNVIPLPVNPPKTAPRLLPTLDSFIRDYPFPPPILNDPENLTGKYLLDYKGDPVPCTDLLKWAGGLEACKTKWRLKDTVGDQLISTVFLGLDHGLMGVFEHDGDSKYIHIPILWETMIFDKPDGKVDYGGQNNTFGDSQFRHKSRKAAYAFHHQKVQEMKHHGRK